MPKINQEEYEVLKELDDKWKWIARNYNGALITYTDKPMKNPNLYWDSFGERMDDRLFQFIQWGDEYPYNIQELIEEYEYSTKHVSHVVNERVKALGKAWGESEEKEVKNIEWLNSEVEKRINRIKTDEVSFVGSDFYDEGYIDGMRDVQAIANQLDEPETLSQEKRINIVLDDLKEYIKEQRSLSQNVGMAHTSAGNDTHYRQYDYVLECINEYEPSENLQNLLVANQDEPETLSEPLENVETFSNAMEQLADELNRLGDLERDIENLTGMTLEQIAEEVRNGGIVPKQEKEQKYNVRFKVKSSFGTVGIFLYKEGDEVLAGDNFKAYYPKEEECRLTEQEIRGFQNGDILFEHFAVKAEELEE